jgi:hypothetical protein
VDAVEQRRQLVDLLAGGDDDDAGPRLLRFQGLADPGERIMAGHVHEERVSFGHGGRIGRFESAEAVREGGAGLGGLGHRREPVGHSDEADMNRAVVHDACPLEYARQITATLREGNVSFIVVYQV